MIARTLSKTVVFTSPFLLKGIGSALNQQKTAPGGVPLSPGSPKPKADN